MLFFKYQGDKLKLIWILVSACTNYRFWLHYCTKINPSFRNSRARIKEIWFHNKTYGFNVYFGALFNVGFAGLGGLLISYFGIDNSGVGFYALALTITEPLGYIPNIIATTHYKDFSTQIKIPKKLILLTVAVTFSALVLTCILVGPFIKYFLWS